MLVNLISWTIALKIGHFSNDFSSCGPLLCKQFCLLVCCCFATALAFLGVKWELEDTKSDSEMNCDSITMPKIEAVLQQ